MIDLFAAPEGWKWWVGVLFQHPPVGHILAGLGQNVE
jgi:hypothetical protein